MAGERKKKPTGDTCQGDMSPCIKTAEDTRAVETYRQGAEQMFRKHPAMMVWIRWPRSAKLAMGEYDIPSMGPKRYVQGT